MITSLDIDKTIVELEKQRLKFFTYAPELKKQAFDMATNKQISDVDALNKYGKYQDLIEILKHYEQLLSLIKSWNQ